MNYFDWLGMIAFPDGVQRSEYYDALRKLYDVEFRWSMTMDRNRAKDGEQLRVIFEDEVGEPCDKFGPCSVLEMMVALAIRCESQIMYDPDEGDQTHIWFWEMFNNLGFSSFDNEFYDEREMRIILRRFLDRDYDPDGYGGPFYIQNFDGDMRKIEIWYQLSYYLQAKFL